MAKKDMAVPITLSVPKWMRDYIQGTAGLKASKIFQDAVVAKKKELMVLEKVKERLIILRSEMEVMMKDINQSGLMNEIKQLEKQLEERE